MRRSRKDKLEKWQKEEWISAPKSRLEKDAINAEMEDVKREWQEAFEKWHHLARLFLDQHSAEELEKLGYPLTQMLGSFVTQVRGISRSDRVAFLEKFGELYALAAQCNFAVGYRAALNAHEN